MGSSTEHSAYGARYTRSTRRASRRLLGGSAALVAAGVVPAALGSRRAAPYVSRLLLWHRGDQADLRPGEPLRLVAFALRSTR